MLIEQRYLKNGFVVLRDVDGSEVNILLEEALELADWINQRRAEIEKRIHANSHFTSPLYLRDVSLVVV